ncbi:hypothetical protein [Bailinhaonella thermotolerans]|uniref:Uncharacterized protein n=1 Tax=Bailinhaonella thermotolerans TaxID=1070861 RepID=A0A3A4AZP2_9ACTN|nr:hypothetical protein [Bailinhaonella thermotolerans]RJL35857.1 hypothetical protein D5H75_03530 [Bailinhaonella thermotolerans]
MMISSRASELVGEDVIRTLSSDDVPPGLRTVIDEGWRVVDGAVVLSAFHKSYHGDRARFTSVHGYEFAVNGRGIPDDDIRATEIAGIARLMRRGIAFAWEALHRARTQVPGVEVFGYVSVAPVIMDPEDHTGNVTFSTPTRPGIPDLQVTESQGIIAALTADECRLPLPPPEPGP